MTRDSVGVTCDGVAVLGASQPQLSVHDSGNSKLGYTWPGCHQPPGRRCCAIPGHRDIVTALAAPSPPQPPCHQKRNQNPPRMWRVVTLETLETGNTPPLQCCSAAGGVSTPGPGQRAAWEPSLHILTPEAGHEQRTPSCVEISSRGDMEVRTQEWQFCSIHTDRYPLGKLSMVMVYFFFCINFLSSFPCIM